jgi:hypothetical protein
MEGKAYVGNGTFDSIVLPAGRMRNDVTARVQRMPSADGTSPICLRECVCSWGLSCVWWSRMCTVFVGGQSIGTENVTWLRTRRLHSVVPGFIGRNRGKRTGKQELRTG